jgi:hypothetical protein
MTAVISRRLILALIVSVLVGCLFGVLRAHASDGCDPDNPTEVCLVVYAPSVCAFLEPYTPLWDFLNCRDPLVAAAVADMPIEGVNVGAFRLVKVRRFYQDGSTQDDWRFVRKGR